MPYQWPEDTDFAYWELDVLDRDCLHCGRMMHICDHRYRRFHTLEGPVEMVCRLNHCPDRSCPGHAKTKSPEVESMIAPPFWAIGWDVFCWIGHRRFSRHMSVTYIQSELLDGFGIKLSHDAISLYIERYQLMLAARQQDLQLLREAYAGVEEIILSIDGLQPEKGHETLYVVRELTQKRVWFAESLLSGAAAEVQRLIVRAKELAEQLGKKVVLWMSDKQDAFLTSIAAEFPDVPHRYCANHFLRDVAKPVMERDSHAKVQMRRKVRGLRNVEQTVLKRRRTATQAASPVPMAAAIEPPHASSSGSITADTTKAQSPMDSADDPGGDIVLDYCAAVRGILNDDQGGPLDPPGLRMATALEEVQESLQRNLNAKKGGPQKRNSVDCPSVSSGDSSMSAPNKKRSTNISRTSRTSLRHSNQKTPDGKNGKRSLKP